MENYRHGDVALIGVESIPKEAKKTKGKTLLVGSGGHPHTFNNGQLSTIEGDDFIIGYLKAEKTTLFHPEHGEGKGMKKAKIADGIYEVRRQVEYTNDGMKQVED